MRTRPGLVSGCGLWVRPLNAGDVDTTLSGKKCATRPGRREMGTAMKKMKWTVCLFVLASLPVFSGSAFASTTPGTLTLSSTFDAISVRASFTGDPNGNNSASIQFRRQGDTSWKNGFTPIVDQRTSIAGHTNPYVNQARGSIVGLQAGTTYEVAL